MATKIIVMASCLLGPVSAMLYESGGLRVFPGDVTWGLWLLVAVAAVGTGIGVIGFRRGARIAGAACFLSNVAVLLLYGFIAVFFATGGSR